jgi:hypothetical protein
MSEEHKPEPIGDMLEKHSIAEILKMDLSGPKGRWKWLQAISRNLDDWRYRDYPVTPRDLLNRIWPSVKHSGDNDLIGAYQKHQKKIFNIRWQNQGSLRSLLKCLNICDEVMDLAKESTKIKQVIDFREYFTEYLVQVWNMTPEQVDDGKANPDDVAWRFVNTDLIDKGYERYL